MPRGVADFEFKEANAVRLGLKKEVVVEDDAGIDRYTAAPAEAEGFQKYLEKHAHIPARVLARIWFHYTRQGIDLLKMSLPPDLIRDYPTPPANLIPFAA